jgi:hypothetical protein
MIATLRQYVAQMGWWDASWYCLSRVLVRVGVQLHKYDFVAQPVAETPWARGRGAKLRVALATGVEQVPPECPRPREVLAARVAQGAYALQAWQDSTLAGFLWLVHGAYLEDEVRVHYHLPSPDSVWDFDVYVAPDFRLGPAYLRLWDEANALLRERQVRWSCSRISSFNTASRNAHRRLGARKVAGAVFITAGRWQLCFASQAPYMHLSASPSALVRLTLDTRRLLSGASPAPGGS